MFEKILKFFGMKLYTVNQVRQFVAKGVITPEQFEQITGESYEHT